MTTPAPDISSLLDQLREQWREMVREQVSAIEAMRAAKMLIGSIQWSKDGGTDQTGWGMCPECYADDFRGHKEGCTVVVVLSQLGEAISNLEKGPSA